MKEGITLVDIEPASDHVDFLGPSHDPTTAYETKTLKGNIRLVLTKATKIKSFNVKFKGESTIYQMKTQDQQQYEIPSPILPKLKVKVYEKSAVLTEGEHLLPWELEIPNIYPMSFSNKRCHIRYRVQVKISLGINRTITTNRPITIKRHLVASQELASLVNSKAFEHTFPSGFHYHISVPKIVCIEQVNANIAVKFNGIPVESISTQITQMEIYRCRHISKLEADVAKKNGTISLYELHKNGDSGLIKYIRPLQPIIRNPIDNRQQQSIVLKHPLEPTLSYDIESPLVAISHQLDVVFSFGSQHDEVRVKVPIIVSSVPDSMIQKEPLKKSVSAQGFSFDKALPELPPLLYQNTTKSKSDETISGSFMGLHPPPRRTTRKKEMNLTLSNTTTVDFSPIPTQPLTPLRHQFLNSSKSTNTSYNQRNTPALIKRRSNSIDHIPKDTIYSSSITNHFLSAELPPLPPPITRQKLPSPPSVDKSEHRKTRMYYDDESDEEGSAYNLLFAD